MLGVHAGLAALVGPELALDQPEAARLAGALANVNAYYGHALNPKTLAWVNLATVAAAIYAPRVMAIGLRPKKSAPPVTPLGTRAPQTPAQSAPTTPARGAQSLRDALADPTLVSVGGD